MKKPILSSDKLTLVNKNLKSSSSLIDLSKVSSPHAGNDQQTLHKKTSTYFKETLKKQINNHNNAKSPSDELQVKLNPFSINLKKKIISEQFGNRNCSSYSQI